MQTNKIQHTHKRPYAAAMTGTAYVNLLANFKSIDAPTVCLGASISLQHCYDTIIAKTNNVLDQIKRGFLY